MAIFPVRSNYVIDVDAFTSASYKAGMAIVRDDNGRAIVADSQQLISKTTQQKLGKFLGFAASDHDTSGNTIIRPDVVGSSYLDSSYGYVQFKDNEFLSPKRALADNLDETASKFYNNTEILSSTRRGIGVYNQPGEIYITDQFAPVLHGDYGVDGLETQTLNPGDLLTFGGGINAGKLVKVNVNSLGPDVLVIGKVEKYVSATGLLHFSNVFYSVTFSSASAVMALDAGNSLSVASNTNTVLYATVCGTAAENGSITLSTTNGGVFDKVLFASYGSASGTCGNFALGACHAANSQSIVESYLLGNLTATIPATNGLFGDPCVGTGKSLYIQARYYYNIQAPDLTINNNNGTLYNGVAYSTDGGGSWAFDGTNDYITMPMTSLLNSSTITWSLWYKSSSDTPQALLGKNSTSAFVLTVGPATSTISNELITVIGEDNINRVGYITTNRNELFDNRWHHIVLTAKPSVYNIYLDGVDLPLYVGAGSNNGNVTNAATSFMIGAFYAPGLYVNGKMADIRVYNRALSASEISAYYNATKSRYGR